METTQAGVTEMQSGLFETEPQLDQRIAELNSTLTEEEVKAETYLEWPDETLARTVRELAKDLKDGRGEKVIGATAGAFLLIGMLGEQQKSSGADWIEIKTVEQDGRRYCVTVREIGPTPDDPRLVLADLDASKETVTEYYDRLESTLRKLKDTVGINGMFEVDGVVFKLVEPDWQTIRVKRLGYVRERPEGEKGGTWLAKKEADEWRASRCPKCGQVPLQHTGEYPCAECSEPTLQDLVMLPGG